MSKLIVVIGVTGNQGGSVAQTFLKEPGWKVRGITRSPSKPSNAALRDAGVELVAANMDEKASLVSAFKGAHAIFAMTDFWQFATDPATFELAKEQGILPNQVCYNKELEQSKNLIDAAADPSVLATLERFVHSTLSDTKKWSKGTITQNLHFDSKAEASKYLEDTHPALAAKTSYVQVGFYMTNWKLSPAWKMQRAANGKDFYIPKPPSKMPTPFLHPPQDLGPFTRALVLEAPARSNMFGYSQELDMSQFCETWTKVMRERGLIEPDAICKQDHPLTLQQIEDSMPGGFGKEVADAMRYVGTYGWCGGDPSVKRPHELGVKMEQLSNLEDYIRGEDWSAVLQ